MYEFYVSRLYSEIDYLKGRIQTLEETLRSQREAFDRLAETLREEVRQVKALAADGMES